MKRMMLVWVMILCLMPLGGWAERTAPTQPPTPPPEMPASTPRSIGLDEGSSAHYDFPTAVDGYVFVSFAGETEILNDYTDADSLMLLVVCRYFEEVYPGRTLEQLKDFAVLSPDYGWSANRRFYERAGNGKEYRFFAMSFKHPYVYGVSFDVLLSMGYQCAFFTEQDPYMADRLEQYQRAPIRCEDAVDLAWKEFASQQAAAGYPPMNEETRPDYLINVSFLVSYNEETTCWTVDFYERQAPYNDEKSEGSIVFEAEFDAFTGELLYSQVFHNTQHGELQRMVDQRIQTR